MQTLIRDYIDSKTLSWSPTTIKKESHRLLGLAQKIDGSPEKLWKEFEVRGFKPYTKKTAWISVSRLWDWAIEECRLPSPNPYKKWKNRHQRLFKNVYDKKIPDITYNEVAKKLSEIEDPVIREQAFCLLDHGMRVGEYNTWSDGCVIGKGEKPRKTFGSSTPEGDLKYWRFYKALKKIGLKPHDLRKIRATDLVKHGVSEADLCKIFGWASFETASSYLAPKQDMTLEALFKKGAIKSSS